MTHYVENEAIMTAEEFRKQGTSAGVVMSIAKFRETLSRVCDEDKIEMHRNVAARLREIAIELNPLLGMTVKERRQVHANARRSHI